MPLLYHWADRALVDCCAGAVIVDALDLLGGAPPPAATALLLVDARPDFLDGAVLPQAPRRCTVLDLLDGAAGRPALAVVRHPLAQWRQEQDAAHPPGLETFLAGYRRFAEWAVENGFVRVEDWAAKASMGPALARRLGLAMAPPPVLAVPDDAAVLAAARDCLDYLIANTLLGYAP